MNTKSIRLVLAFLSAMVICIPRTSVAIPEAKAAVLFLNISPDSRSNGMGEAGAALLDQPSGYYNPAAPASFASNHFLSYTHEPSRKPWLPALSGDRFFEYQSVTVGWRFPVSKGDTATQNSNGHRTTSNIGFTITTALNIYRTKLDFGRQIRFDERGNIAGEFSSFDKANNVGISVGFHSLIDINAGITIKSIESKLAYQGAGIERGSGNAEGTAYDIGLLFRVPVVQIAETITSGELNIVPRVKPILDLAAGLTWKNRGGKIAYFDESQADPLPGNNIHGIGITTGAEFKPKSTSIDICRFTYLKDRYTPVIDGKKYPDSADDMSGYELGILETYQKRGGNYRDEDGELNFDTEGYTIRTDGIFKLTRIISEYFDYDSGLNRALPHLSFSYTSSKEKPHSADDFFLLSREAHAQVVLSF